MPVARFVGAAPAILALATACAPAVPGPEAPAPPAGQLLRAVPLTAVTITDSFWLPRLRTNAAVTIPHILDQNELTGRVDNFRKGAGLMDGDYQGRRFNDTDIYKVIEAASYALQQEYDADLDAKLDTLIVLIAAAQQEDGYLMPARTIDPSNPAPGLGPERWMYVSNGSHELYNAGHLIEAGVAHYQATGKRALLDVAIRFADRVDRDFGLDARRDIPGHEEIELALVKLADLTGEARYLELARFFLEQRGQPHDGDDYPEGDSFVIYNDLPYKQDHMPVTEQSKAAGHAVRAMYLFAGMADVAARSDAPGYREALDRVWADMVTTKLYITGGVGSRGTFESFGEDYELPNRSAYAETCAAVGNDLWNHRMFLSRADPRYLDVLERVLYNGALSGVSSTGDSFFYTNPLESDGRTQRSEYFDVACCPANLARLLALLPGFVYAQDDADVFVNLYVASEAGVTTSAGVVRLEQITDYPWQGAVRLIVQPQASIEMTLHLRIPGWARGEVVPGDLYRFSDALTDSPSLTVNGAAVALEPRQGFATIRRTWNAGDVVLLQLPMPVRRVAAHDAVEGNRGKRALQRGPLVFSAESIDNDGSVLDLLLPEDARLDFAFVDGLLGGLGVIRGTARRGGADVSFQAIPYFARANRGPGEMVVWIPFG